MLPHEYWLTYLLAYVGATDEEVRTTSELYGLGAPEKDYLAALRGKFCRGDAPKTLTTETARERTLLHRLKIQGLALGIPEAIEARELLGLHKARKIVQSLIFARSKPADIVAFLKEMTGHIISEKAVKLFKHYFWNVDKMTQEAWLAYLDEDAGFYVNCEVSGENYALWKLGYRAEVADNELMVSVLHEAQARFFETSEDENTKDTAMKAKLWSEVIFKALDEKNKSGDAVKKVLEELKNISIALHREDIKSIKELSGGHHSKKTFESEGK